MTARLHPDDIEAIAEAVAIKLHSRAASPPAGCVARGKVPVRERRERAHGPYRKVNTWRVVIVAANGGRCTETFASEKDARSRITEFEREFTSRTIASAVDAYLAA